MTEVNTRVTMAKVIIRCTNQPAVDELVADAQLSWQESRSVTQDYLESVLGNSGLSIDSGLLERARTNPEFRIDLTAIT